MKDCFGFCASSDGSGLVSRSQVITRVFREPEDRSELLLRRREVAVSSRVVAGDSLHALSTDRSCLFTESTGEESVTPFCSKWLALKHND